MQFYSFFIKSLAPQSFKKCLYSTKFEQKLFSKEIENALETYKNKIHYNSLLVDEHHHLSFKKRKVFKNIEIRNEKQKFETERNVKPFPISLKYLNTVNGSAEKDDPTIDKFKEIQRELKENLQELGSIEHDVIIQNNATTSPKAYKTWMQDYEYFDENITNFNSEYGTPDRKIPVSKIPCGGCGAILHCADSSLPGYIPSEIFKGRTNSELKTIICQRCHFLKNYNTAINVRVNADEYKKLISTITTKVALPVILVDLLDFPSSLWPGLKNILGTKRPIFLVGNKVDLLPRDSKNYLKHIKSCLYESAIENGLDELKIQYVGLISATTGYGVEELITEMHNKWGSKGDVYLIGCTNVGKSSLFNALLKSDFCKVKASNLIQRATASPWPGTTLRLLKFPILRPSDWRLHLRTQRLLSEKTLKIQEEKLRKIHKKSFESTKEATLIGHIGRTFDKPTEPVSNEFATANTGNAQILTLNESDKEYINSKWCYDTPGVIHSEQILNSLTTDELLMVIPSTMIVPRTFMMKPSMSLFLGGLGRIDYINGSNPIRMIVYSSNELPVTICDTESADEIYRTFLGSEILGVPIGIDDRLNKWSTLKSTEEIKIVGENNNDIACDVTLSSAGWIGLVIPKEQEIEIKMWTPDKKGIYIRKPSLLRFGNKRTTKLIRGSLEYKNLKKYFK